MYIFIAILFTANSFNRNVYKAKYTLSIYENYLLCVLHKSNTFELKFILLLLQLLVFFYITIRLVTVILQHVAVSAHFGELKQLKRHQLLESATNLSDRADLRTSILTQLFEISF